LIIKADAAMRAQRVNLSGILRWLMLRERRRGISAACLATTRAWRVVPTRFR